MSLADCHFRLLKKIQKKSCQIWEPYKISQFCCTCALNQLSAYLANIRRQGNHRLKEKARRYWAKKEFLKSTKWFGNNLVSNLTKKMGCLTSIWAQFSSPGAFLSHSNLCNNRDLTLDVSSDYRNRMDARVLNFCHVPDDSQKR